MALFNTSKKSLHNIQSEIENLISTLDGLRGDASDESRKSLKILRGSAERALSHSRDLLGDAYEEVKDRTYKARAATCDYSRENPLVVAGLAIGAAALIGYLMFRDAE
ncbi:DUF883 family protein [Pseudomonas mangiferae]|uniref:DUF883 family protein n=1 Tax=Pseudomonas mangiferae TaxID=2593654 RepID=A0A553GWH0_9PSED|nr:DUF883 family protein [Pseudomonas mangiferae]TRX73850.1 DUF883 family protein [Pseudomonas mangiferae]